MTYPTPTNGERYYCTTCGLGFGEFVACKLPNCRLETRMAAQIRSRTIREMKEEEQAALATTGETP